ncbi:hypothetical protein OIV83_002668 [Microbotryomycetes sp. JL201]|nr:hypothetical protein OIV83_002668 [Microbotryomycetes sp. JL201]
MSSRAGSGSDSDEDAWDEVDVTVDHSAAALAAKHAATAGTSAGAAAPESNEISITIARAPKTGKGKRKTDGSALRDRMIRQQRHKAHAAALLAVGLVRNRFINDETVQAILVSKVPLSVQNAFFTFSRQTHENERDRGRLFEDALKRLLEWWFETFELDDDKELVRRDVEEVEHQLARWRDTSKGRNGATFPWEETTSASKHEPSSSKGKKGKGKARWGASEATWEEIDGLNGFSKHAQALSGSRDMSAQLFTCLCRALDIPARLVYSLQPIDWRSPSAIKGSSGKRISKRAEGLVGLDKGLQKSTAESVLDKTTEQWQHPDKSLSYRKPKVNLRKTKQSPKRAARTGTPEVVDPGRPPVFWVEAYSRYNKVWISLDPVRKRYRCKSHMEPPRASRENQLLYAVAYEEDESVRDVTPRYAKSFTNVTAKARAPSKKNTDWFEAMLIPFHRNFQLARPFMGLRARDRVEEKELWDAKHNEPFPTSVGGFKNHPNYVLEQHLLRDEMLRPGTKPLGLFKGTEPVYPRSAVVTVKSEENYWRIGRIIKPNEIPFKWVKARTVTINKKRAEAMAQMEGEEAQQQALYAYEQTALYKPPPVKNGKVPRNKFGNIDLYVPSMLPDGAIHLTSKHAAKCAKALGVDYAEAITGFEFRQRRANPVITGIVVASDQAELLLDAIAESEHAAEEREFAKLQERCLKRWRKLILGLRIRQRVQASYRDDVETSTSANASAEERSEFKPVTASKQVTKTVIKKRGKKRSPSNSVSPPPIARKRQAQASRKARQGIDAVLVDSAIKHEESSEPQTSSLRVKLRPGAVQGTPDTPVSSTTIKSDAEDDDDFEYDSD